MPPFESQFTIDIDILTLLSEQQASIIISLTEIAIHSQLLSRIIEAMTIIFCGGKPRNEIVLFQMEIVLIRPYPYNRLVKG